MRYLQRALIAMAVAAAAAGTAACDNTTAPDREWRLQVALTAGSNRPSVGDQVQFGAFIVNANSNSNITENDVNVASLATWSYGGPAGVVSISDTGLVTALGPGAVIIQAAYGGKTGNQSLIVE